VFFTYGGVALRLWAWFYRCGLYLYLYRCSRGFYLCRRDFTLAGVVFTSIGVVLPLYAWTYLCWRGFTFVWCGIKSVDVA